MYWFKWTYFHNVRSYFCSAAVKFVALLMLPPMGTSVSPRLAAAVLCRCWVQTDGGGNGNDDRGKKLFPGFSNGAVSSAAKKTPVVKETCRGRSGSRLFRCHIHLRRKAASSSVPWGSCGSYQTAVTCARKFRKAPASEMDSQPRTSFTVGNYLLVSGGTKWIRWEKSTCQKRKIDLKNTVKYSKDVLV